MERVAQRERREMKTATLQRAKAEAAERALAELEANERLEEEDAHQERLNAAKGEALKLASVLSQLDEASPQRTNSARQLERAFSSLSQQQPPQSLVSLGAAVQVEAEHSTGGTAAQPGWAPKVPKLPPALPRSGTPDRQQPSVQTMEQRQAP